MNPTSLSLSSWAGYRAGRHSDASDGTMTVAFHGKAMTPVQRKALLAAEKRDTARHDALVDAILTAYPTFRPWKPRPKAMTRALLKSHVELWELMALADQHEGVGYIAYVFSTSWDPSGFKIITCGDRIVLAGSDVLGYPIRDPMRTPPAQHLPTDAARRKVRAAAEKRAKKNPKTLRVDDFGEAMVALPCWSGFVNGPGDKPATGNVMIELASELEDLAGPAQQAAYRHVLEHADGMQRIVCDAIAASFAKLVKGADPEVPLPASMKGETLRDFIELRSVQVHAVERHGVAYVGYLFGCRWDGEHGVGVMTHGERVVKVGGADTAILGWIAARDRDAKQGRASTPIAAPAARKAAPRRAKRPSSFCRRRARRRSARSGSFAAVAARSAGSRTGSPQTRRYARGTMRDLRSLLSRVTSGT